MSSDKPARIIPPVLLGLLFVVLAGAVVWLQVTEGLGDEGMNNAFSYVAVLLGLLVYALWFLAFSRQRGIVRVLPALLLVVAGLVLMQSIDGWTGSMVPIWKGGKERAELAAAEVQPPEEGRVDLTQRAPTDFPGFLGPQRDATIRTIKLSRDWSSTPPEELWRVPVGPGWSGFAVVNGIAITQEERADREVVVARDGLTGEELWRHAFGAPFDHPLGGAGPRATPLIEDGRVYAHGVRGHLVCLNGADGMLLWEHDLYADYGMTDELEEDMVQFGRSCSPLAHGELLIIPASGNPEDGQVGLAAFDRVTGELRWESPARHFSHASPRVGTVAGVEQLLVMNESSVTGHDLADGRILWEHPWPGKTGGDANNSDPLVVGEDGVLISKGYGKGSKLLKLLPSEDGSFAVEETWASRRALKTKLTNAVVLGEHAYALSDGMLECVALADGKRTWKEGRYGHGQLLLVGALLLVLSEEGEALLVEASPGGEGAVLGRFQALEGATWNTFALAGELLIARNGDEACAWRLPVDEG